MRLFVALPLPANVASRVAPGADSRRGCPRASWVRAEAMHLTLAFLGEQPETIIDELVRALGAADPKPPGTIRVGRVGAFPKRGPVRVVWLAVEPAGELEALARRVRAALTGAGIGFDDKPFRPHLTLARCRPPWPSSWRDRLDSLAPEPPVDCAAEPVTLFRSTLSPGGSRYEVLARFPEAA